MDGLDETRRLLYMALLCHNTEKYELAGTLVNALTHHHPDKNDPGWSREVIADKVVNALDGDEACRIWVARQIQRLTEEIGRASGSASHGGSARSRRSWSPGRIRRR
jgi:hypothetical protein